MAVARSRHPSSDAVRYQLEGEWESGMRMTVKEDGDWWVEPMMFEGRRGKGKGEGEGYL